MRYGKIQPVAADTKHMPVRSMPQYRKNTRCKPINGDLSAMVASQPIDYQTIFQHAPVGMCISQHRVIHACNDALARMFGYRRDALVGQSFAVLYPSLDEFERTGARIVPV